MLPLVGWSVAGASVPRIIGDGTLFGVISVGETVGVGCALGCIVVGGFGDSVDGGEVATGFKFVFGTAVGLKIDGRAIGLAMGWGVVELENPSTKSDGAQDGCVLFESKQRHVGTVRPLLSTVL